MTSPLAVAITGGIGAGKSETLASFARHGAAVVSSDQIVHELLRQDAVKDAIVARFGHGVVGPDGFLDRGAIASVVFTDPESLAFLESLLHPLVSAEYLRWRKALGDLENAPRVCVTEVPLLYEAGSEENFDKVVVITAPADVRRERSQVATDEREQRLLPEEEKVARADYVFENAGSLQELDRFVASVMEELTR